MRRKPYTHFSPEIKQALVKFVALLFFFNEPLFIYFHNSLLKFKLNLIRIRPVVASVLVSCSSCCCFIQFQLSPVQWWLREDCIRAVKMDLDQKMRLLQILFPFQTPSFQIQRKKEGKQLSLDLARIWISDS